MEYRAPDSFSECKENIMLYYIIKDKLINSLILNNMN